MTPLQPADIFVIQAAIEQYKKKHPGSPTPSAEVALAWLIERRTKRRIPMPSIDSGLFARIFESLRFLFKPLSSASR